jgi:hypothetical protein
MNSIEDLIKASRIPSNNSTKEEIEDYTKSIISLEGLGYRVLRYSLDKNLMGEELGRMVFENEISQDDVIFNKEEVYTTQKAINSLKRRQNKEFLTLDTPVISFFSGKDREERILYYNNKSAVNKQTPTNFLKQKIDKNILNNEKALKPR